MLRASYYYPEDIKTYSEKINKIRLCVLWKGLMQIILDLMSKN